ncbi:N-acetyltransferase [Streptomyces uncialis]|uniref:N-acetyltransferase n=1 Tax=Streptomyces uncialis TaxID=1048205 RepID=UPI003660788F
MPSSLTVRTFRREDRDQLTDLVNSHVAAVVPGAGVSVNTVISSLERRPDEYVTDPWVAERVTLVVEHHRRIVAAAHLLRYRDDPEVGADYRDTGHLAWSVHLPTTDTADTPDTRTVSAAAAAAATDGAGSSDAHSTAAVMGSLPYDGSDRAAGLLMSASLAQLDRWRVRARLADGQLPAPGVYGIPEQWPHIRAALERAGFVHTGGTEILLLAPLHDLPDPERAAPLPGLTAHRALGAHGTRLTARLGSDELGYVELDTTLDRPERHARSGRTADLADFDVREDAHPELFPWLLGRARAWLALCGTDQLLTYVTPDETDDLAALTAVGFHELTRTARGWEHRPS